jgi:hypothetical protein
MNKKEIQKEIEKCSTDPAYFIRTYVNIEHPIKGIIPFDLYKFQERIIKEVEKERFNVIRKFRQAGITTICAAYSLWSIIFKKHHNVMVVSIGDRESRMFLARVVLMYDDLPTWLRPGIKEKNKHTLHLSTGSRVKSQPAGAGRGEAVSHLMVDEAAFIDKMREFWAAIYPTIATGGKATLISTVNGMSNLYYELYRDAELGKNSFNIVDLHWREHPEYTEEWAKNHKPIIGERMWLQEFECSFLGTGDTFLDRTTLQRIIDNVSKDYSVKNRNALRVWKDPDPYQTYTMGVDASYGRDQDYSAFHIINNYNGEQVAEFYSNKTPLDEFAKIITKEGVRYNLASVVVERNALGLPLIQKLFEGLEYENLWMDEKSEFGIQITQKSKESILSELEDFLRNSNFKINSKRTADEFKTFIINENGKIIADDGYHDDLVMSLALCAHSMAESGNTPVAPIGSDGGTNKNKINTSFNTPIHVSNKNKIDEDISWLMK